MNPFKAAKRIFKEEVVSVTTLSQEEFYQELRAANEAVIDKKMGKKKKDSKKPKRRILPFGRKKKKAEPSPDELLAAAVEEIKAAEKTQSPAAAIMTFMSLTEDVDAVRALTAIGVLVPVIHPHMDRLAESVPELMEEFNGYCRANNIDLDMINETLNAFNEGWTSSATMEESFAKMEESLNWIHQANKNAIDTAMGKAFAEAKVEKKTGDNEVPRQPGKPEFNAGE